MLKEWKIPHDDYRALPTAKPMKYRLTDDMNCTRHSLRRLLSAVTNRFHETATTTSTSSTSTTSNSTTSNSTTTIINTTSIIINNTSTTTRNTWLMFLPQNTFCWSDDRPSFLLLESRGACDIGKIRMDMREEEPSPTGYRVRTDVCEKSDRLSITTSTSEE